MSNMSEPELKNARLLLLAIFWIVGKNVVREARAGLEFLLLWDTYYFRDVLSSLQLAELEVTRIRLDGLANQLGRLGFSLSLDNLLLTLLLGTLDQEDSSLGLLLGDLFGLDGSAVLRTEAELGDRDVIEDDVKVFGALDELAADHVGHQLTLSDELTGVEFGDHALEHFVADGWQDAFVVVKAQLLIHVR